MIKAIETVYKGYRFRSRLEARWAVFFDALGIKWEYEKEGYDFNGTHYLPDFYLPHCRLWLETKPSSFFDRSVTPYEVVLDATIKLTLLQKATGENVAMIVGQPYQGEYKVLLEANRDWFPVTNTNREDKTDVIEGVFGLCRRCEKGVWVVGKDIAFGFNGCCERDDEYLTGSRALTAAYAAARSARFEHGERPKF